MGFHVDYEPRIPLKLEIFYIFGSNLIGNVELAVYDPVLNSDDPGAVLDNPPQLLHLGLENFSRSEIDDLKKKYCKGDEVIAVSSRVSVNGSDFHLPQIDFTCENSRDRTNLILYALQEGGQTGSLVASGRSYHFYGDWIMTPENWVEYMKHIRDAHISGEYVTIALDRGYSALRISTCRHKPHEPYVLARIRKVQ